MAAGVDGLLRDKTRPSRIAPLKSAVIDSVVSLTLTVPPGETTHWTAAMMAAASNISASAVRRIWKVHGLQAPDTIRSIGMRDWAHVGWSE